MILPVGLSEIDRLCASLRAESARVESGGTSSWVKRVGSRIGQRRASNREKFVTLDHEATQALVEAALAGDEDAFASLFREYDRDVLRVCRRALGDLQSAEDAVSEVFLRARRALSGFDTSRPFRPWLLGIASHYCIDQLRRRTREAGVFSSAEPRELDLASRGLSPLARIAAAEERQALERAIGNLSDLYRLPLLLRYFEDLSYDEIGESLGVSRAQVGTLLFRAKRLLRAELEPERGGASRDASRPNQSRQRGGARGRKR